MATEDQKPAHAPSLETPRQEWIRPVDIAALAMAMSVYRSTQEGNRFASNGRSTGPKDYIEESYELLAQARKVLEREAAKEAEERAALERENSEGPYEAHRAYRWKEIVEIQNVETQDAEAMAASKAKFLLGKKWKHLSSKVESGAFRFTDKDLRNRPIGFSMVGGIGHVKGLRQAVNRLFPNWSQEMIAAKQLELWQVNEILFDQLRRNHGKIPKSRAKARPSQKRSPRNRQ